MKSCIKFAGFLTLAWLTSDRCVLGQVNPPPSTQPAAVLLCEQRYDQNRAYSAAPLIVDGVSDRIAWPRPATCRRLLAYVTGGNSVSDRDGERPELAGKTPWRDIDAARYRIARDAHALIAQGTQGDAQNYNRWRFLCETRGVMRRLARFDAERLAAAGYDGPMIDNFNAAPFVGEGGSMKRLAGWEWIEGEFVRDCLAEYVLEFRLWYRLAAGREAYVLVNVSRPQVWSAGGAVLPLAEGPPRMRDWLAALGVDGVMVENPLKYGGAEGAAVRQFCDLWKATGKDLVLKRTRGAADLGGLAEALKASNVFLSSDQ